MKNLRINGIQFEKMVKNGLAALRQSEERINDMNVFPVADGDTGTNMSLTLEKGIVRASSHLELCYYLKELTEGMLLGARGNSGVILSQFFKGIYLELARCAAMNAGDFRNALIRGYKTAYAAVVHPVEGTILTVAREGIENIRRQIVHGTGIEQVLAMYIAEMKKSQANTPKLLADLKNAGVTDSGAEGLIVLFDGMLKLLEGRVIKCDPLPERESEGRRQPQAAAVAGELFNENSVFEEGYCLEFLLQLMNGTGYNRSFRLNSFINDLDSLGNSLAVVADGTRVKVHIHTLKPARVITAAQEFGEFVSFKLENMQLQRNEQLKKAASSRNRKPLGIVSVANGSGMKNLFTELGSDIVIDGGSTMNTSTGEFLEAFDAINASAIVVLPNNKNIIKAAEQAAAMYNGANVFVLPTRDLAEGYFALAMDVPDSSDVENRLAQMRMGSGSVITLAQTTASRDYSYHELSCRAGEEIVLKDDAMVCVSRDSTAAILDALATVEDISDRESCLVFSGFGMTEEQGDELAAAIGERYPLLEVTVIEGGQSTYRWLLGIS